MNSSSSSSLAPPPSSRGGGRGGEARGGVRGDEVGGVSPSPLVTSSMVAASLQEEAEEGEEDFDVSKSAFWDDVEEELDIAPDVSGAALGSAI